MALIALLGVLAALLAPCPAIAATVRVQVSGDPRSPSAALIFESSPGEANRVTLAQTTEGAFLVSDTGAPLTPGSGCAATGPGAARCDAAFSADVHGGDLDDVITVAGRPSTAIALYGGPGSDFLFGGGSSDFLFGGPGDDVLRGGDGTDTLDGDGAGYGVTDAGGGRDTLDGGAGTDTATYERRYGAIAADIGTSTVDGAGGERDALLAVEGVTGGVADDVIIGDDGPNALDGGPGADRVSGRDGADRLTGGRGVDVVHGEEGGDEVMATESGDIADGGPGDDFVNGGFSRGAILDAGPGDDRIGLYGRPRSLVCGEGADTVGGNLDGLRLDGCEQVRLSAFDLFGADVSPRRSSPSVLLLPVGCRARGSTTIRRCRGTVVLRLRRAGRPPLVLGRRAFSVREDRGSVVVLHVRRRARRALRATARPLIDVQISGAAFPRMRGPGGVDVTQRIQGRWRVRLRPL